MTYDWTVCPSHVLKHFTVSYVIKLALPVHSKFSRAEVKLHTSQTSELGAGEWSVLHFTQALSALHSTQMCCQSLCSFLPLLGFSCSHCYVVPQLQGDCKVIHRVKWLYCLNLLAIFSPSVTITNSCTSCKIWNTIFCASCLCNHFPGKWNEHSGPAEWPAWCPILTPYHLYLWGWWAGTTDFRYFASLPLHFLRICLAESACCQLHSLIMYGL